MPIEFRKRKDAAATVQPGQQTPPVQRWISLANKLQVEERLFHFLRSLRDGRPQATVPLLVDGRTLRTLYTDPNRDLLVALQHCLDQFLVELGPDAARWGTLDLSPAVLGVALATYNCLCPLPVGIEAGAKDSITSFTSALIDTLLPARTLSEMLAYHALLHLAAESLPVLPESRATLMHALLNRSPLSALYHLHLFTPPPLTSLAAELWPWWRRRIVNPAPWANLDDWLRSLIPLLGQPAIAAFLRRRWLSMPETRPACRNLGLLLEALRHQGGQREFILEFYEAYDFFHAETVKDPWHGIVRCWPILDRIECLLRADGDTEAAIHLNRLGNEYFLMFRPLLAIIIAEHGLPRDYNHLTRDLVLAVRTMLDLTTEYTASRLNLGNAEFTSEDEQ